MGYFSEDLGNYDIIPAGTLLDVYLTAELTTSKAGNEYLALTYRVRNDDVNREYRNRKIWVNVFKDETGKYSEWKLASILRATDNHLTNYNTIEEIISAITNKYYCVEVSTYTKRDGTIKNGIKKVMECRFSTPETSKPMPNELPQDDSSNVEYYNADTNIDIKDEDLPF